MLLIGVISLSIYAYLNVRQVQQEVSQELEILRLQHDKLENVRSSYFLFYRNLDLFLLDPLAKSVNIQESINTSIKDIRKLKFILESSDTEVKNQVRKLSEDIFALNSEIDALMKARLDVQIQYPGVSLAAFEMSEPQNSVHNSFRILLDEIENKDYEPESSELYPTLLQAQTLWVRLVSQMRIYLANRLASFSLDILKQQAASLESYYQQLVVKLDQLEMLYETEESFEGPDVLKVIKTDASHWRTLFSKARNLLEKEDWRADSYIMRTIIIPLSDQITNNIQSIQSSLAKKETTLATSHENNSNILSQLLLVVIVAFLVFITGLILSIDWLIFRPLLNVSQIFKARALDNSVMPMIQPTTSEMSNLIESFQEMDKQINLRHIELENQAQKLAESEERWSFALEGAGDGVWDWNPKTDEAIFSRRWNEIIGYAENEFPSNGTAFFAQIHPDDRELTQKAVQEAIKHKTVFHIEFRLQNKTGDWKWILSRGKAVGFDANGTVNRIIGTHSDISERKYTEEQLQIAATTFESIEGVVVTDPKGIILRVNTAFTKITGYTAEEAIGQKINILKSGRHDEEFYRNMWQTIDDTGGWQGEIWDRRKNGEIYPKWLTISAVKDNLGRVTHYVGTHHDISAQKESEEQIRKLAFFDPLTGLPNRTLLQDRIDQNLTQTARNKNYGALLLIDLDNFKMLNDTLGHHIGDKYLQEVALRLQDSVRKVDTVARLGGDEFVVVLSDLSEDETTSANAAEHVAETILATLNRKYTLDDITHQSSASIGISLFSGTRNNRDEIIKQADMAMYKAKSTGHNMIRFFDPIMESSVLERANLEKNLRQAMEKMQFTLFYQGQIDSKGNFLGAEVLLRWLHPQQGLISPADFIPVAEETGLILSLGNWVLETACIQQTKWATQPKMEHMTVSVNVSARQFNQHDFIDQVTAIIKRTGANPKQLKLELTESLLIENVETIISKISSLKALGVCFSLDDFGTGYSSLAYLRRLPLDQLKIDRSFVINITKDNNDLAIAKTIIDMGNSLGIDVIAEGVETESQRHLLDQLGCKNFQGYLICKPLPIDDFEECVA
jgi:diguanylate cyclase (GGDEF)-like protein/PAS domain S-box-containing protein